MSRQTIGMIIQFIKYKKGVVILKQALYNIQNKFVWLTEKIESALIIRVIRAGLINMIPLLTVGAFALTFYSFPNDAYIEFIKTFAGGFIYQFLYAIYMGTFGLLSVHMAISFSYSYCSLKEPDSKINIWCILSSLVSFLILDGITSDGFKISSLGAVSVFIAMVVSIASSAIYLAVYKKLLIKWESYSYGADSRLNSTLVALIPTAVTILAASVLAFLVTLTGKANFNDLISGFLNGIFSKSTSSFFRGLGFILLSSVLWFFGIHGSNCLQGVSDTFFVPLLDKNIEAIAQGGEATEILCKQFFDCFILMGGCGSSICLLIAILIFTKDKSMRDIAKTSSFHILFNINELIVFGLPIVFNPIMLIPFITVPIIQYLIAYGAVSFGLVPVTISAVEWSTPVFVGGYVATGSIAGSLLQLVNIIVGVIIYAPFVYMMGNIRKSQNIKSYKAFVDYYKENADSMKNIRLSELGGEHGRVAKTLALELKRAIATGDYKLFYQPQYNYQGKCIGVEALLRWRHSEYGYIYPPLAISLARETNLLENLEKDILRKALDERDLIQARFGNDITISVNVSGDTISNQSYWKFLEKSCTDSNITPGLLCIEVTEQEALTFDRSLSEHINDMKKLGITFAIDDFSAGQTSIHYLQEELFDKIKLDGALVRGIIDNPRCGEIISSIVKMADSLNISILAEFVESEEAKEKLHAIGCDNYQGYLYSPPVDINSNR